MMTPRTGIIGRSVFHDIRSCCLALGRREWFGSIGFPGCLLLGLLSFVPIGVFVSTQAEHFALVSSSALVSPHGEALTENIERTSLAKKLTSVSEKPYFVPTEVCLTPLRW